MKKFILPALFVVATLGFTACGSDDDGDNGCETCGEGAASIEICDNGDGTITLNGDRQDLPEGLTFEQAKEVTCAAVEGEGFPFGQAK